MALCSGREAIFIEKKRVSVSVRTLVETVLLSGDLLYSTPTLQQTLWEGSAAHRTRQKSMEEGYEAEVPVFYEEEGEAVLLRLQGRIDGVRATPEGTVLEEIKTYRVDPAHLGDEGREVHWAQAYVYGAILCRQRGLDALEIQLVYIHLPSGEAKILSKRFTAEELWETLRRYLDRFLVRLEAEAKHEALRNDALNALSFPYGSYRPGQRAMAADVYRTVRDGGRLLAEAPTGIGKTAAALFPALKAIGEGRGEKIFYLCSRTTVKLVAEETLRTLCRGDVPLRRITLTAKEKACPHPGTPCDPRLCPRAAGFFDRLPDALMEGFRYYDLSWPAVLELAERFTLCPFELSLSLAEISDVVVCDYNYAFDPRVRLFRFFQEGGDYVLLVDEAHNLIDRAREMFSARLTRRDVREVRSRLPKGKLKGPLGALRKATHRLNQAFRALEETLEEKQEYRVFAEPGLAMSEAAQGLLDAAIPLLEAGSGPWMESLVELFFRCKSYLAVEKAFDQRCLAVCFRRDGQTETALYCVDPSARLQEAYDRVRAVVLFSATLTPPEYYQRLLGLREDPFRRLPSPFFPENLRVLVRPDVSTAYKNRDSTTDAVARCIGETVSCRAGHYMAFFPSYRYMTRVLERYALLYPQHTVLVQDAGMEEGARTEFLRRFEESEGETLVGFVVMGGFFAEGIDLSGDRLIGAVLVGVGLPQIGPDTDLIRRYHEDLGEDGFAYACFYPGFRRVLQAAGRVLRSPEDRGVLLLIDPRFTQPRYRELMPDLWFPMTRVLSEEEIRRELTRFWREV